MRKMIDHIQEHHDINYPSPPIKTKDQKSGTTFLKFWGKKNQNKHYPEEMFFKSKAKCHFKDKN